MLFRSGWRDRWVPDVAAAARSGLPLQHRDEEAVCAVRGGSQQQSVAASVRRRRRRAPERARPCLGGRLRHALEREREIGEIRKYEVELVGWLREAKAMMRNESR